LGFLIDDIVIGIGFPVFDNVIGRSYKPISWLKVLLGTKP